MDITGYMESLGHEELHVRTDPAVGLRAFVAIHDTTLGPALGGVRVWPHATESEAILDVLRLSRAMTYKAAAAGLPLGGGKALIMADPATDKTEALFRSYGRFVDSLNGRYVTTEDVGATTQDLAWTSLETRYVVGLARDLGGSGNPAMMTAYGLLHAMRACAQLAWNSSSLAGRTVAIQGFGNVARSLAGHLLQERAYLVIADIKPERSREAEALGERVRVVPSDQLWSQECDILAPCALGGILNAETIPQLRAEVVCGAANNQLKEDADADRLEERGILYAPDYIVNAGGVINVYHEIGRVYDQTRAMERSAQIYDTVLSVVGNARAQGISTVRAADALAMTRLTGMPRSPQEE